MSEEVTEEKTTNEESEAQKAAKLAKVFRLIEGEEILMTKKPSIFGFLGMYVLGGVVLMLHILFGHVESIGDDAEGIMGIIWAFIDFTTSDQMSFSFVFVMLFITWINRLMNTSTSGRWVTIWLFLVALTPVIIQIDDFLGFISNLFNMENDLDFIPFAYSFTIFGLIYSIGFWMLTFYYQNSFHYAITSDAVIFEHSFLLSRSHRRILFDRISEVIVDRSPVGTICGFATVSILTDSGVGIVDETLGAGGGVSMPGTAEKADDNIAEKASKSLLRSFFSLISYQRTIRTVRPDPKCC
jgi:hypothetical protein